MIELHFPKEGYKLSVHDDIYICKSTVWICKLIVSRNVRLIINSYAAFTGMPPKLFKTEDFNLKKVASAIANGLY